MSSVLDDPLYIACCTVLKYYEFGWRKDSQVFCYVNRRGDPSGELVQSKWSLQDVKLFENSLVQGAKLRLIADPTQVFTIDDKKGMPIKSFQSLWTLFSEIDENCSTGDEAKIYFDYFVKKLELAETNYTLQKYKKQIEDSKDLVKRYEDLLNRISSLVNDEQK